MNELENQLQQLAGNNIKFFKHPLSNNKDSFSLVYNSFIEEFPYKLFWFDGLIQIGFEISKDGTRIKRYEFSSSFDIDEEMFPTKFNNITETISFLKTELTKLAIS